MGSHSGRARALVFLALAASSLFCVALLAARPYIVGRLGHVYLTWNLVLAWIPFLCALVYYDRQKRGRRGVGQAVLFAGWLAFLPNAPYIVTDLIHLPSTAEAPLWFDTSIYIGFAWTGLMLGLASLYLVHTAVRSRAGAAAGWAVAATAAVLSGFGIYLGRFLRWNSWDILTNPAALLGDLAGIAADPQGMPMVTTALFASFIGISYLGLYAVAELRVERDS